jgi:hypothetical protein
MLRHPSDSPAVCVCCEPWVIEERRLLREARLHKVALLRSLSLRGPERMSFDEIRRIAAFDRAFGTHRALWDAA